MIWPPSGIVDERRYYFPRTALVTRHGIRTAPDYEEWVLASLRAQHPTTVVWNTVGMPGYALGRGRHIIDPLGLGDPLLARLPAMPRWRIGHYERTLPEGYFESVLTDSNRIADPRLAAVLRRHSGSHARTAVHDAAVEGHRRAERAAGVEAGDGDVLAQRVSLLRG